MAKKAASKKAPAKRRSHTVSPSVEKLPAKKSAAVKKVSVKRLAAEAADRNLPRVFTLDVVLTSGPITEDFYEQNPVVLRQIQIRGDQTLEDLHFAIFDAFGRDDEHLYEFLFGKGRRDLKAQRYGVPSLYGDDEFSYAGYVDETTLDALDLKVGRSFFYWFDFGDDWWHDVKLVAIDDAPPKGKFPKVVKRVGKSPPQYPDDDF